MREKREPSSAVNGFLQVLPRIENQVFDDPSLRRVSELYLPYSVQQKIAPELSRFGDVVLSKKVLGWVADAEKHLPFLRTWDAFGRRKDELVTSEGWRNLQDLGIREGITAIPYENEDGAYSRVHQFLKYHIWSGSSAYVICPSAMSDGAASLLSRHFNSKTTSSELRRAIGPAYHRLVSRDPAAAWTSGQWMTERTGGSDVSGTETLASKVISPSKSTGVDGSTLGDYSISGFKWFSSATDANMTILLARTEDDKLSVFYAPMRRTIPGTNDTELNGVSIQRLKSKLGTRPVPTAELELKDMRGYLLGNPGQGIREISTILNITRMHNSVTAMGLWGRGLGISRAFAKTRSVGGRLLVDIPAYVRTMAKQEVEYRGLMQLTFFTVLLLGISQQQSTADDLPPVSSNRSLQKIIPSHKDAQLLLRLLTPVTKAITAKASIAGLGECMESLGGVGYLENDEMEFNIARLLRDAGVLSIWEGTTDIMAADMLKVIKGKQGNEILTTLDSWLSGAASDKSIIASRWAAWLKRVRNSGLDELKIDGREIMSDLSSLITSVLLMVDFERDGDQIAGEVMKRWIGESTTISWEERVRWDKKIVFGDAGRFQTPKL